MRRKSLGVLLVLVVGLLAITVVTARESRAADGNCYASTAGPSTPTICD